MACPVGKGLGHVASVVVEHRLSCPAACAVFPEQESNPCLLHWQADSLPLSHQGSPLSLFLWVLWLPSQRSDVQLQLGESSYSGHLRSSNALESPLAPPTPPHPSLLSKVRCVLTSNSLYEFGLVFNFS